MNKHIPLFEEFISEDWKKQYGQKIKKEDFAKIEVDSIVLYAGTRYKVLENDGYLLKVLPIKGGLPMKINLNMFNKAGAILENLEVFEALFNGKKVVIFPGRFQPFHLGHIAAFKKASEVFGLPVIPIQILSKNDKSPFPDTLLEKMGKSIVKEYDFIEDYILYPSNLKTVIPQMVKYLRGKGFEAVGMGAGSDRMKAYEPQIKYINSDRSDVPVSEPFRLEMVDERIPNGPSGTKVRKSILDGDEKAFNKMTPKSIRPFYKELEKYVDNINESRNKMKPFNKVKKGDEGEDYFGIKVKIIDKGDLKSMMKYDDTGVASELKDMGIDKEIVAVKHGRETLIYSYGDDGVIVY